MSVNSSSSSTILTFLISRCVNNTAGILNFGTFTVILFLLLPLYVHVILLILQRRRSGATMSHSDAFTFHMVVIELMNTAGFVLCLCSILTRVTQLTVVTFYLFSITSCAQQVFHVLTCVERYLAAVHPVTYLSLKKAKGIRIRNITIACVWLLCTMSIAFMSTTGQGLLYILSCCGLAVTTATVFFCSVSVLCVLVRPGPGEGGGVRHQVCQSKLRAFYTMVAILGALMMRFVGMATGAALYASVELGVTARCLTWLSIVWINLPSSLVLPLLFLQRAGKLMCCRIWSRSGPGPE